MAPSSRSNEAARNSPFRLFLRDARILFPLLRYLPWLFIPFKTDNPEDKLYQSPSNTRDTVLQGILFFLESVILLLAVPLFLVLPGLVYTLLAVLVGAVIWALTKPTDGSTIAWSRPNDQAAESGKRHTDERWVFVNGCAASHGSLQSNIDILSATFGRPVVGVHNKTFGLLFDILECLIQRDFTYDTLDVRVAYDYVKGCLCDPTVRKVVLIGHSQGGIIISLVIDELLKNLPRDVFDKVEIYTFGSAASHWSNPVVSSHNDSLHDSASLRQGMDKRTLKHIEHYCNENDMVSRWGALYSLEDILNYRYSGTVFVRMGATGHLFNQHYLAAMFPLPPPPLSVETNGYGAISNGSEQYPDNNNPPINEASATNHGDDSSSDRSFTRQESGGPTFVFGNGNAVSIGSIVNSKYGGASWTQPSIEFLDHDIAIGVRGSRGKSVRQLSRLWKYAGGRSPNE